MKLTERNALKLAIKMLIPNHGPCLKGVCDRCDASRILKRLIADAAAKKRRRRERS